jgi:hypothetical protein
MRSNTSPRLPRNATNASGELGEQIVDHRRAIGVQDLAFDRADPEVLQRGIHLGRHLRHALVDHCLHAAPVS